jgi:hypothetical protein
MTISNMVIPQGSARQTFFSERQGSELLRGIAHVLMQ